MHRQFSRDGYGPSKPMGRRQSRSDTGVKTIFDDAHLIPKEVLFAHIRSFQTTGDIAARNAAVTANLRMIHDIARCYIGRGLDFDDLVDHGVFGLMHAIGKFDCGRGCEFSTYASYWIKQNIRRGIIDEGKTIRIPPCHLELRSKIRRFADAFAAESRTRPTIEEIATGTGISCKKILACMRFDPSGCVFSGDIVTDDWQEPERHPATLTLDREEMERARKLLLREHELHAMYPEALAQLDVPAGKREIFRRYLGLNGYPTGRDLKQVGEDTGFTRQRVNQIANEVAEGLERIHAAWWDYKWYLGHGARVEALERVIG